MSPELGQAWMDHLETVRWFGGKGAGATIRAIDPLVWWTAEGAVPGVRSEIATLDYPDGTSEAYHLLVAYRPSGSPVEGVVIGTVDQEPIGSAVVIDATTDPEALQAFVSATAPAFADRPVNVWSGEQSNTTLTLGGDDLYKLFRKVEPGPNLDAEVLVALAGDAVPAVRHRLVAAWPTGTTTDLGIIIERVPQARDGWVLATDACAANVDFTTQAHALGEALAEVHRRLGQVFPTGVMPGDAIADTMTARLDTAVTTAPVLAPYADALAARFGNLRGQDIPVQRVHGDFHLGQTLLGSDGWVIIDFEGEPAKTATERRAPDSVWRDVAGMLRSFDYARSVHSDPGGPKATGWSVQAQNAFLTGYCGSTTQGDLLRAYDVDKAIYEVLYELRNRPDWVEIPLTAVREAVS